jgi:beta-carotene hydroxylase
MDASAPLPGLAEPIGRDTPAPRPLPGSGGRAGLTREERHRLSTLERQIAARHIGAPAWGYTLFTLTGFAIWVAMFPLAAAGLVPLWLAFVVSTVLATAGYVPCHEAMHCNIARKGSRYYWLNELVGEVSTIPLICPYSMARVMHLEHHYHCNDPLRDPDYPDSAPNAWKAIAKTWWNRQPRNGGAMHNYKRILAELGTPAAKRAERDTVILQLGAMAFFFAMAWSGYALVIAAVWWLPRHIALSYIRFYLSWAPHHPRQEKGRYGNTRPFKSSLGNIMSLGMQYHVIHHLYPNIPIHRTKPAYYEMRDILAARGVDVHAL